MKEKEFYLFFPFQEEVENEMREQKPSNRTPKLPRGHLGYCCRKEYFRNQGLSELWMPKKVIYRKDIPVLGSGKIDYVTAQTLLEEK